jgi:uncharacterized protein YdhG (YjbR/CyaY superfamily)
MLVGFGVTNKYCSLYTMSSGLTKKLKEELKELRVSGTTLHFLPGESLPIEMIKRIVAIRMRENEVKAMSKK